VTDHPSTEMLDQLLADTLGDGEARWMLAHLLGRCKPCVRAMRAALDRWRVRPAVANVPGRSDPAEVANVGEPLDSAGSDGPGSYDGIATRSVERSAADAAAIGVQQLEAAGLSAILDATPRSRRLELIAADRRFHSWPLASRLLDAAAEFHWQEAGQGLEECRLALAIAERLPAASYPDSLTGDLLARAHGALADTLRLAGRLPAARKSLERAWQAIEIGTGDPLEQASLLRLEADLQLTLGDGAAAAALLRPAGSIYRLYGERHHQGRTLQKLAVAIGQDDPAQGAEIAERALALVEAGRDPRLELAARHTLIWFLNDSGRAWQALDLFERWRALYHKCGDSEPQLLMPWLEGRICRRLGELAGAERRFAEAWHRFRSAGFRQEQTLVSLDLAEVWMAQGKIRPALRLLRRCEESLRDWRMHREGMAAWVVLLNAAAAADGDLERAQGLLREAAQYFRRAWRRALPFARLSR
jgi:tetratricopeptide (TPR) repeat protein